jgi:serine/threonine-protein kinase
MVTDFGIARAMDSTGDSRLTATGMAIGTPAYMSPEQAAGDRAIDGRSDLYSLGILGYQMLTGEPPFTATSTPAMLVKHISERPIPVQQRRADVPADLARSVMVLLEKEPANRFPNAAALVTALDTREAPELKPEPSLPPASLNTGSRPSYAGQQGMERSQYPHSNAYPPVSSYPSAGRPSLMPANQPTYDELRRWDAPPVVAFRRKIAPYLFVNGVILLFALFGQTTGVSLTVLWSIYIAFKYARLWSEGYDWRDVFRQPRDREFMEVIEDVTDHIRAIFDKSARAQLRAKRDQRKLAARMSPSVVGPGGGSYSAGSIPDGPSADRVRQAFADRDEIFRRLESLGSALPGSQKEEVSSSAAALADKVQSFALALDETARTDVAGAREQLEREITTLENAANPLERGSEERVRRLAYLKRQRRALVDTEQRRQGLASKLDTCALALQNMRFDLMRLGASPQMHQHITGLANQAIRLAENVDDALFVADEMGRLSGRPASGGRNG